MNHTGGIRGAVFGVKYMRPLTAGRPPRVNDRASRIFASLTPAVRN